MSKPIVILALAALTAVAPPQDDFEPLLSPGADGNAGWSHHGPGRFDFDPETGVLESHGGMGLHWYSAREFSDFVLELEFKTSKLESNSGIFVRVPGPLKNDDYIYHSLEIQIYDDAVDDPVHLTGAAYDAAPASHLASKPTGEWNQYRISFIGERLTVQLNGETVLDWDAEPGGKVRDITGSGFIGLQNHDRDSSVWFRNVRIKEVAASSD